jgi:hypothetical protein
MTLTGATNFGGRLVSEQDAGGGSDGCYFPNSAIEPVTSIPSPGDWLVGTDNTWRYDTIGYVPALVAYLRTYRPVGSTWPCSITLKQNMVIACKSGAAPSKYLSAPNTLQVTIDLTTVTSSRAGVSFTRAQ